MKKTYAAACIGCGSIAQHLHLPGYASREDIGRIIGVDPEPARLAEVRAKYPGIVTYPDYATMFAREQPDFVSVCTPNALHATHAVAALESGAHLLLEKPMALSMDEVAAIRAAAARAGKPVMVGFSHRMQRGNRQVAELLRDGAIGEPFMIRVRFAHMGPFPGWAKSDWFYDPALAGGGALLDMGIHAIDICQWLLGPITSVAAQMGTLRKTIAVDDNAVMALEFAGRALGYIEVGWTSRPGFLGVEIYGDEGTIINDYAKGLQLCKGQVSPDHDAPPSYTWEMLDEAPTTGGWKVEIDYFIDTALNGGVYAMGLEAGATSLAVALAAITSAREGRRIDIATVMA